MIIDLIDKLISRSIDLVHETEKRHRDVFNDFVNPLFQCFEDVHKDYMDTFRKVHQLISDDNPANDSEIEKLLRDDSLFTMTNRRKLNSLAKSEKPKIVKEFVEAIENYLNGSFYLVYGEQGDYIDLFLEKEPNAKYAPGGSNRARSTLWSILRRSGHDLPAKKRKEKRLLIVGQFLQNFQEGYANVVSEYGKLKNDLLNTEL